MRVSVFGLGYVGTVTAACLADLGHEVLGVDVNEQKAAAIREGRSPIVEDRVGDLLDEARRAGRLDATTDQARAARETEVALLCVGTPTEGLSGPDLRHVHAVADAVGAARRDISGHIAVAIRSTVPPGTVAAVAERLAGHLPAGAFGVAANPEFLREGTAVADFLEPPFTVIGTDDDRAHASLARLYEGIRAPLHRTSVGVAELMKYACNSYHALKVAFANEMGTACRLSGVDGQELMRLFCEDTTLNVSAAYLRPGAPYGGSCLPKDVRALDHLFRLAGARAPLAAAIEASNHEHLERAIDLVLEGRPKRAALLGLAFKAGTDDVRESPPVRVAERLLGRGVELRIHDPSVRYAALLGANKAYLDHEIPHITRLLTESPQEAVEGAEVVALSRWTEETGPILEALEGEPHVVDMVGIPERYRRGPYRYSGLCW
jgi:GDP-mannose 6-dehydrogenase